jgi:hypothetical protein
MQTQAELFLARAIECEKRAAKSHEGKLRSDLLKLAEYYRSLSKRAKTRAAA